jgi:hypothetical protein
VSGRFDYLLERIHSADFEQDPYPHLYINNFLSEVDFAAVNSAPDIRLPPATDIHQLFESLESSGFDPIGFPGCTNSKAEYIRWLEQSRKSHKVHPACEAQGMAFRLARPSDETVRALDDFFKSPVLVDALRRKFALTGETTVDAGVHKYLHGYEISPHPDIRRKALTWMLNVNPAPDSENLDIHTHYMILRPERSFVSEFWKANPSVETCWVPWEWCTTAKRQRENNSIVFFAPSHETFHAIRAHYDHLVTQRTQFYGNLWYAGSDLPKLLPVTPRYDDYDLLARFSSMRPPASTPKDRIRRLAVEARRKVAKGSM